MLLTVLTIAIGAGLETHCNTLYTLVIYNNLSQNTKLSFYFRRSVRGGETYYNDIERQCSSTLGPHQVTPMCRA